MRIIVFITVLFISFTLYAEEQAQHVLPDIAALRNPFISPIPKPKIIEPVVAPITNKPDNTPGGSGGLNPVSNPKPSPSGTVSPMNEPKPVLPKMNVQGLVWRTEKPLTIIDGSVLGINDPIKSVKGAKVSSITKDSVGVLYMGETFHVKMDD